MTAVSFNTPGAAPCSDGPMNTPDFNAAAAFVAANARVLDRRRFQRLFEDGPVLGSAPVRDAVAAYRNDDGGFGHALEPDCRAPGSQPAAAEMALRILDEADAWDEDLVRGACDWLVAVAPAEGGAAFVEPTLAGWPHAPWWVPEDGHPASLVATGMIAGTLYARGVSHPWLGGATAVMWNRIGALSASRGGDDLPGRRVRDVRRAQVPPARAGPGPGPRGLRSDQPAAYRAEPGRPGSGGTRRGARGARLRAQARFAGPQPLRRRDGQGASGPSGPGPAGRRRLDVQLAVLVTGRRTRLARLPHRRRPPHPSRQRATGIADADDSTWTTARASGQRISLKMPASPSPCKRHPMRPRHPPWVRRIHPGILSNGHCQTFPNSGRLDLGGPTGSDGRSSQGQRDHRDSPLVRESTPQLSYRHDS